MLTEALVLTWKNSVLEFMRKGTGRIMTFCRSRPLLMAILLPMTNNHDNAKFCLMPWIVNLYVCLRPLFPCKIWKYSVYFFNIHPLFKSWDKYRHFFFLLFISTWLLNIIESTLIVLNIIWIYYLDKIICIKVWKAALLKCQMFLIEKDDVIYLLRSERLKPFS